MFNISSHNINSLNSVSKLDLYSYIISSNIASYGTISMDSSCVGSLTNVEHGIYFVVPSSQPSDITFSEQYFTVVPNSLNEISVNVDLSYN